MKQFDKYAGLFAKDKMEQLASSPEGMLWLKVKSVTRKDLLDEFRRFSQMPLGGRVLAEQSRELYDGLLSAGAEGSALLDKFIKTRGAPLSAREQQSIASELHKMQSFSWGGNYTNALDKHLIDRYVKKLRAYDDIGQKLLSEIPRAVQGYVLCSWYNHWSTILIEDIFNQHKRVLPALGKVKKIDFFVDGTPVDLKTTYLPANFVQAKRKEAGLPGELTALKSAARKLGVAFDKEGSPRDVAYEISERMKINGGGEGVKCLEGLRAFRKDLLAQCIRDPGDLLKNLYTEQGEMRFDSSNRLFVVLADAADFEASWKLKRNPELLKKNIHAYLNAFSKDAMRQVRFTHKAKTGTFCAKSDAIFVVVNNDASGRRKRRR